MRGGEVADIIGVSEGHRMMSEGKNRVESNMRFNLPLSECHRGYSRSQVMCLPWCYGKQILVCSMSVSQRKFGFEFIVVVEEICCSIDIQYFLCQFGNTISSCFIRFRYRVAPSEHQDSTYIPKSSETPPRQPEGRQRPHRESELHSSLSE